MARKRRTTGLDLENAVTLECETEENNDLEPVSISLLT